MRYSRQAERAVRGVVTQSIQKRGAAGSEEDREQS